MIDMNRRTFLGAAAAGVATLGSLNAENNEQKKKPNILIIYTDQQSRSTLGSYGDKIIKTNHINSLADEGAVLTNFYTNSAVCTPSRGCFLTGRYPHANGAYTNNKHFKPDEITWAMILKENGYDTGYSGKWHLDGAPKPGWAPARNMGFTDNRFMFNRGHWKKIEDVPGGTPKVSPYNVIGDEKTFTTDWLTDKTVDFIKQKRDKPFAYMVSIPDPHQPFTVRSPYDKMFKAEDMEIPQSFYPDKYKRPSWAKWMVSGKTIEQKEAKLRKTKAQYFGEVKCIDDNVGRMIKALKETGQYDNTIVIFTTDHGEFMGEHGLMFKNKVLEGAYRLPFIVRWPGGVPKGKVIDNMVSTVDFQQTLLGLVGVKASGREQGRDASPLLTGQKVKWDDFAYLHHSSFKMSGIVTPKLHLGLFEGNDTVFYDKINDPDQLNNLVIDKKEEKQRRHLIEKLVEHHKEVQTPESSWIKA